MLVLDCLVAREEWTEVGGWRNGVAVPLPEDSSPNAIRWEAAVAEDLQI